MKKFIKTLLLAILLTCSSAVYSASETICAFRGTLIYHIGDYRSEKKSEVDAIALVQKQLVEQGIASFEVVVRETGNVQYILDWMWKYPKLQAFSLGEDYYKNCVKYKNGI